MKRGFTLIELLVVISIISLLASVVMSGLNSARLAGRDSLRISTIKEIQKALELYYLDEGTYPPVIALGATTGNNTWVTNIKSELVDKGYLGQVPIDPTNTTYFHYRYYGPDYDNQSLECGGLKWGAYQYVLIFNLEGDSSIFETSSYTPFDKCIHGPLD